MIMMIAIIIVITIITRTRPWNVQASSRNFLPKFILSYFKTRILFCLYLKLKLVSPYFIRAFSIFLPLGWFSNTFCGRLGSRCSTCPRIFSVIFNRIFILTIKMLLLLMTIKIPSDCLLMTFVCMYGYTNWIPLKANMVK